MPVMHRNCGAGPPKARNTRNACAMPAMRRNARNAPQCPQSACKAQNACAKPVMRMQGSQCASRLSVRNKARNAATVHNNGHETSTMAAFCGAGPQWAAICQIPGFALAICTIRCQPRNAPRRHAMGTMRLQCAHHASAMGTTPPPCLPVPRNCAQCTQRAASPPKWRHAPAVGTMPVMGTMCTMQLQCGEMGCSAPQCPQTRAVPTMPLQAPPCEDYILAQPS